MKLGSASPSARSAADFDLQALLAIRAWTLAVLSAGTGDSPPAASPGNWKAFLAMERCAHPLRNALSTAGIRLPDPAAEVLDRAATQEMQRILSAAGQLRTLAHALDGRHGRIVVVKGAVEAVNPSAAVDMADVDILLNPTQAMNAAATLEADAGYVRIGEEHGLEAEGLSHLAQRLVPGGIQVELHYALKGLPPAEALIDRAVPLAGARGLHRLAPADHLHHLLHHSVLQHLERRGAIRDLLLIASAVSSAPEPELETVRRAFAGAPGGSLVARTLSMAVDLARGAVPRDWFATHAAARYLLHRRFAGSRRTVSVDRALTRSAMALVEGRAEYARLWRQAITSPVGGRRAGRLRVAPLRALRLAAASVLVLPTVLRARAAAPVPGEAPD